MLPDPGPEADALTAPLQNSSPTPAVRPSRKRKAPEKLDPKPATKRGRGA